MNDKQIEVLLQVFLQDLLLRFGPTLGYAELAQLLGSTIAATRLRQHRHKDLPPSIGGLQSRKWATPTVAAWLIGLPTTSEVAEPPRRGRPRKTSGGAA
jgi:hypothetical protein